MADLAAIVTIVAFFVAVAMLTRGLDRVIADTDREAGEAGREPEAPRSELQSGRSA